MGATEQLGARTALQVVSYLQPWEDNAMKLLKLKLGQESGVNTSSREKMPGEFLSGQA